MIHISDSLVLSEDDPDLHPNQPVIGWQNVVLAENVSSETEDDDHPVSNVANPATHLYWVGDDPPTDGEVVTVETGTADDVDYIALARHNFGTAGISVTVEAQEESGGSWTELFSESVPADDSPILYRFDPQPLFALRFLLSEGSEHPRIAVIYCGKLTILQRRIYVGHTPITMGRSTRVANNRSESGEFLGRVILSETVESGVSLQNLTPSWYRENMEPFLKEAQETPFFFAWRPSTYPKEIGYCWLTNDPQPENQRANGMMSVSLDMSGVV